MVTLIVHPLKSFDSTTLGTYNGTTGKVQGVESFDFTKWDT